MTLRFLVHVRKWASRRNKFVILRKSVQVAGDRPKSKRHSADFAATGKSVLSEVLGITAILNFRLIYSHEMPSPIILNSSRTAYRPAAVYRGSQKFERLAGVIALAVLVAFFALSCLRALYKPLWFDEIISILIAKQPDASDMWAIAKSGADGQPPLYDYLIRWCVLLLHNDALGLRLPSIIGFFVFCWSLFEIVSRRISRWYGLIALLFPVLGGTWYYATEGRPYGLLLGFSGLAALSWQSVALQRHRVWALIALSASLAAAISIHFFAPVLLCSLGLAELARSYWRRQFDWPVWIALSAPVLVLIPYLSVIRSSSANSGEHDVWFARAAWYWSALSTLQTLLDPALLGLVAAACIFLVFRIFTKPQFLESDSAGTPAKFYASPFLLDGALALSFTVLPLFGIALSRYVTHLFFTRYVISGMLGLTLLFVFGFCVSCEGRRLPAMALTGALLIMLGYRARFEVSEALSQRANPPSRTIESRIPPPARTDHLPIAIADEFHLFDFRYYASPEFMKRIFYLSSEKAAKNIWASPSVNA